jgi:NiFe hydrogenase small subunit HydA
MNGKFPSLDKHGRPKMFYGKDLHENECPRRGYYEAKEFATDFGSKECLYQLGCRGPTTKADCPSRLWNNTTFCVNAGGPCVGCVEPGFPDQMSPFNVEKEIEPEVATLLTRGLRYLSEAPGKLLDKVRIWASVFGVAAFILKGLLRGLLKKVGKR